MRGPAPDNPPPSPDSVNVNFLPPSGYTIDGEAFLDAFFDYDSNQIRPDAAVALKADADSIKRILARNPSAQFVIEGHNDEKGSAEYNLVVGDNRAAAARDFLAQLGIAATAMKTISYGKERPQCTDFTEACFQRNRRVHIASAQ